MPFQQPIRQHISNALIDARPLAQSIQGAGNALANARNRENMATIGEAAQGGNLAAARDMALRGGYIQQGMQFGNALEAQQARTIAQARQAEQARESKRRFDEQLAQQKSQFEATHGLNQERLKLQRQKLSQPTQRLTTQERNFLRAQQDPKFATFVERMKRAGAPSVNIHGDKKMAEGFAKRYFDLQEKAGSAESAIALYDIAEQALNTGVRTGALGEFENTMRSFAGAIGIGNPEKLKGGELMTAVQNRLALNMRNPASGMGMPGAVSDRDIKFLKDSQPGLDRSPASNAFMIEAFRRIERRKIEIASMAQEYAANNNGRLDVGFTRVVREFAKNNPLFAGMQAPGRTAPGTSAQPAAPASSATQQPVLRFNPETGKIE